MGRSGFLPARPGSLTFPRTLVELAAILDGSTFARAVSEARVLELLRSESLGPRAGPSFGAIG